ncbi:hypothetical protein [Furfurilactobacillus milii]|uniref:hypothetical protein n=1 Tax=Furfurilactobacillus milii TaxID=2888272 RepID=UPI00136E92D7|nr:hypothetical protein [Furfurilactobacillus milii]
MRRVLRLIIKVKDSGFQEAETGPHGTAFSVSVTAVSHLKTTDSKTANLLKSHQ